METKFYITIGRQKGAGGLEIAEKLSKEFGIPTYDKQVLEAASSESGISKEVFAKIDEKRGSKLISGFFTGLMSTLYGEYGTSSGLSREELFRIQSESIIKISDKGSAIFVGRCADYILRNKENCLNVFITASGEERVNRLLSNGKLKDMESYSLDDMIEILEKHDNKRASYYNYFSYKKWGDSTSYDLCLNSTVIGIDGCVKIISDIIKSKGWSK